MAALIFKGTRKRFSKVDFGKQSKNLFVKIYFETTTKGKWCELFARTKSIVVAPEGNLTGAGPWQARRTSSRRLIRDLQGSLVFHCSPEIYGFNFLNGREHYFCIGSSPFFLSLNSLSLIPDFLLPGCRPPQFLNLSNYRKIKEVCF